MAIDVDDANIVGNRTKENLKLFAELVDEALAAAGVVDPADPVADLTVNGGAIPGTNDGDIPTLTLTSPSLFENSGAIGGTNDGNLPDLTTPDTTNLAAAVREVAAECNKLVTDGAILKTAIQELAAKINEILDALRDAGVIEEA